MKLAKSGDELINLQYISVSQLQTLFDQGKRNELICPACLEQVKLYLGIHEPPYFYHQRTTNPCPGATVEAKSVPKTESSMELNGFKLPTSRTITEEKVEPTPFLKARPISKNPAFVETPSVPSTITSTYLNALQSIGIQLDQEQLLAATTVDGPVLVLSGAGSGKTRVLTVRTAYMLMEQQIDPRSIMLVTFTAKSAKEMQQRLLTYPNMSPSLVSQIVSGTFHSIFYKILLFHEPQKWRRDLLLKWDWEKEKILKQAGRELELDEKEFAYDQALGQIGLWKNSLVFPRDVRAEDDWEKSCLFLYEKYEEYKAQNGYYDFDDMLVGCYQFLQNHPDLLLKYQQRFRYFLIDEFQDINKIQYELIKILSILEKNVFVVGDDDQAIYSFRGSDPQYILNFAHDFPGTKTIKLTENYRSSHEIVSTANRIISRNQKRLSKTMHAQHNNGAAPILFYPYDEEAEATMILTDIQEKLAKGARPSDFAILYRTHSMSRAIFERLAASNIPFIIEKDAESFYQRRVIRGILAFLRLSVNPDDTKAAGDVLSALFLKQSVLQELKAQTILQDCDYIDAFGFVQTKHAFQQRKLKKIPAQIRSLKNLSPLAALEIIEKDLGYQDFIKKRGNEAGIEKGSDDIRDLRVAAKRFDTVEALLEHVDHMTAMIQEVKQWSRQDIDAVQLTTIHRAKGLEYESVYLLAAVDGSLPHDFSLEAYRKGELAPLEEERRLLYVAATRAKQQLSISVPQTRRGKTAYPSRFLKI
ncbi:ATP-dependent helicase [Peribacillus asahii]|uniref:DNA 3'-5' helicase n=1 Tax=Peribacillus asahii TaxID=228899 RepID=A0A398B1H7_9BACI|nr:ATP-dependent helicase [Peribacillus asahii]RID83612.1 ATP-dependent helicase [Peribacillus asahii]